MKCMFILCIFMHMQYASLFYEIKEYGEGEGINQSSFYHLSNVTVIILEGFVLSFFSLVEIIVFTILCRQMCHYMVYENYMHLDFSDFFSSLEVKGDYFRKF